MRIEFSWLRYHLFLFSAVLSVGFVIVLSSATFLNSQRNNNVDIEKKIKSTYAKTATLINDAALIDSYQNDYDIISSRGFLSKENRLSWVEQLERTATRLKLNNLQYHIDPQLRVSNSRFNSLKPVFSMKEIWWISSMTWPLCQKDYLSLIVVRLARSIKGP